jgi:hypothetical protein
MWDDELPGIGGLAPDRPDVDFRRVPQFFEKAVACFDGPAAPSCG